MTPHHPGQGDRAGADAGRGPPGHRSRPCWPSWMPCRTDSPFLTLDPPQRRQRTLDALKRVLLRESQVQPLLLVFEDLHWIDTETQALLDSLVESLPTARLLLLVNYRPEYQHGWGSKTYYTQLRLDPLPPASADELAAGPPGGRPQSGAAHAAPDRAHGGQSLLPGGERAHPGRDRGAGRRAGAPIVWPNRSTAFRCRPRCRRCWRRASTGCRRRRSACCRPPPSSAPRCPCRCCRPLPTCPKTRCTGASRTCRRPSSCTRRSLFPEREYTFKHALTHEVAYGSLLQERRRALHARIVEALEALAGDRLAEQVERLAHHALRGEVWDKALVYCRQAGDKGHGAVSLSRGRGGFRAGARSPWRICRRAADTVSRPSISGSPCARRSCPGELWAYPGPLCARPRPSPRPWTTIVGWAGLCHSVPHISAAEATCDQAIVAGQRALALATASGDVVLAGAGEPLLGSDLLRPGRLSSGDRLLQADRGVPRGASGSLSASVS